MPIAFTNLTHSGDSTNATVYTTASISPGANRLVLLAILASRTGATPDDPTISGNGLTWVQVAARTGGASSTKRLTVYRAMGASPSTGAITLTFANQLNGCNWLVVDVDPVDTGGTNGSAAVVQSAVNSAAAATSLTVTLAAFADAANVTFGAFGTDISGNITPGTGFTEIGEASTASPVLTIESEYQLANDTTVDATTASANILGIALEIKAAASGGLTITLAVTESADTLSSAASASVNLSLAVTEAPGILSSAASASVNLTAAITESADTVLSSAFVALNLTLAKTESADTLVSTASVSTNLSTALVESSDTLSSSASIALNLSLAATEAPDTLAAVISVSGLAERMLTFAVTESPDTIAASASVGALPTRTIDAILIELPDTLASSASVSIGASLGVTEQGDTLTASVSVALNLSLSVTESPDTLASSASVSALPERVLTFAVVESPDTLNASAIVSAFDTRILTLAITEARDTLSADALTVSIPFTSVHASITQRGVGTLIAARVATPAIIQRVPSVGVVRAGAEGRITQSDIRIAITQEP